MIALARFPDWRERLAAFVHAHRSTPHVWGASDCGLTATAAVAAFTGEDIGAPMRAAGYTTRFGALRALLRLGHRSVIDYFDARLERTKRPRTGDIVVHRETPLDATMIADGRGAAWFQGAHGLTRISLPPSNLIAWTV